MLVGRAAEWGTIEDALTSARRSEGRVVLLRGEAGVGKSALLDRIDEAPDLRVLRAAGVEAESDLPYATAHQLLQPLLPLLEEIPEAQAAAVRVALGMAAGGTPDRFLVALGLLSLVSEAARSGPVALLLDDVQWWDTASLDAMLFLGRRIAADPVLLALAVRDDPGTQDPLGSLRGVPGFREIRLGGLAEAEVRDLVSSLSGIVAPHLVSEALVERTHGNPLALVELARVLTPAQVSGLQPLPEALSLGDRLERAFLARAGLLSPAARDLLLLAAAEPGGEFDVLTMAAAAPLDDALDEAEAAGLVRYDGRLLSFSHPLARSAVYGEASARTRREAHRRLAVALAARGDHERSVWHRAAATLGVDDDVASALDQVAADARRRSGYASAAAAYERAAELSSDGSTRLRRLGDAADAAWSAGQTARTELLVNRAEPLASDPAARGRLLRLRGQVASRAGELDAAHRLFLDGAEMLRTVDPSGALEMLADGMEVAAYAGDVERVAEIHRLARGLVAPTGDRERFLAAWLAVNDARMRWEAIDEERVREDLALCEGLAEPRLLVWRGVAAINLGELGDMHLWYGRALDLARAAGAAGTMPYVLEHASMSLALAGKYAAARSGAEEGLELARETGQERSAGQLLAILAFVAATKGDEAECRRRVEEARAIAVPRGIGLTNATVAWSLARLALGSGRYDEAIARMTELAEAGHGARHPVIRLWSIPDLVEAAARARRTADVAEQVAWAAAATRGLDDRASATTAWCRGLIGGADAAEQLASAADGLGRMGFPLAQARARLSLGELLRRDRQPRAARVHLRAAMETFQALGADVWTERAAAELRASGDGVAAAREVSGLDQLTAQELQIVRMAGRGASNKEIAAQLFISPRTVEYHLYKAYPKLGISSRNQLMTELADKLAAAGPG